MQKLTDNYGTYLLRYYLEKPCRLSSVKRFANKLLPPGYYYYSGSAQKGLSQRICRHLRTEKKIHWHIDHITANPAFTFSDAFIFPKAISDFECEVVSIISRKFKLEFPLDSFGNSDCNICRSHLLYTMENIDYNHLLALYHSTVRLIPSARETFCS